MHILDAFSSTSDFHLLETTGRTQTATMALRPGEASSDKPEHHPHSDQVLLVLEGELAAEVGDERVVLKQGQCVVVPAAVSHRFRNESDRIARTFSVYGPPAYQTDDPT